jgi:hypothetical protein
MMPTLAEFIEAGGNPRDELLCVFAGESPGLDLWDHLLDMGACAWRIRVRPEPLDMLARVCDRDMMEYADDPAIVLERGWAGELLRDPELVWLIRPYRLPEEVADFESRLVLR